tara:strand:+ start:609 stop:797 length:189 start_codon:yes stop_codon:yes gene_type:complete
MIEQSKNQIIDQLLVKINILENQITKLIDSNKILSLGIREIYDAGDCGKIAEKTLEELNNIK